MKKQDKVRKKRIITGILILAVLLLAFGAVRLIRFLSLPRVDTSAGLEYIRSAEADDISSIEQKISRLESGESGGEDTRNAKDKFAGTVVMGDAVAAGFTDYDILNASSVVSKLGAGLDGLEEQTEQVKGLAPRIIFLAVGRDEIAAGGDTENFREDFTALIRELKEAVPGAHIFVNSVFPALESASEDYAPLKEVSGYNSVLEQICDRQQIGYIDNSGILSEAYYESDGVHLTEAFYTVWADYMAEVAAL